MKIEEVKELLPDNLTYPLPDSALDNLIEYEVIGLLECLECNEVKCADYVFLTCTLAALIELKERREEKKKEWGEKKD